MRATLVVPDRDRSAPSGGDRYDARLADRWPGRITVLRAPGSWPVPDEADVRSLAAALGSAGAAPVLLDGLVGCAVPEVVEASAAARPTALLVHSTLSAGAGAQGSEAAGLDAREGRALRAADLVVTTSRWSATDLRDRYGLTGVVVARPGADPTPVAPGSGRTPRLLVLAALTPVKNHAVLLPALAGLRDRPWHLVLAGPAPDRHAADGLLAEVARLGLTDRVTWAGPLTGAELERVWRRTDLLVHPSRSETWGMVVTEALAHGIPAVVTRGTGAQEALTHEADAAVDGPLPGAAVRTDDPGPLAEVLRLWLDDAATRAVWREAALTRRGRQPGWDRTARTVADALAQVQR
ncbi:glycosyltransferase family 4 protein [Ornithinimicrobium flavum]|uniref:glycosyltransferase family 4 protein n=1 Tax=Ornithinimicrobium flavum TaxID=1288636 RepID=UPI00106F804B|nr:glycosyltransferase family 4 protein [Ornithinimicrobium flavum]